MASGKILEGVFAINKPIGMSSAQVIRDCQECFNPSSLFKPLIEQEKAARSRESNFQRKRRSKIKQQVRVKMGHGGTLDPLATGVLILGVGRGTKTLQGFLTCTKTYETVVVFGASTDTYDRVGRIIKRGRYDDVTRAAVEDALGSFRGRYKQMPPLYSALKMDGKPLYEYAREGRVIPREIATRDVEVADLDIVEWYEPGTHRHWWPAEEAPQTEKNLADSVWQAAREQQARGDAGQGPLELTPEQAALETEALEAWKSTKRAAEERVDTLVSENQSIKRKKTNAPQQGQGQGRGKGKGQGHGREGGEEGKEPVMSGALGKLPGATGGPGSNLIPPPPGPDALPPWEGKGPPAVKLRMTVTSGFYVRSLCHDLGEKLQCGAMMAELCRSRQSDFVVGSPNCLEYDDLAKGEDVWAPKVSRMLSAWMSKSGNPSGSGSFDGATADPSTQADEDELTADVPKSNAIPPNTTDKAPKTESAAENTEDSKASAATEVESQPSIHDEGQLAEGAQA